MMSFPNLRLRRLRKTGKIRELLEEVRLSPKDLICPIFVQENLNSRVQGESMPGMDRLPLRDVVDEVNSIAELKIPAIMVFGMPSRKDDKGTSAFAQDGIVQRAISEIRKNLGNEIAVITDVCLCQYTTAGHCGLVKGDKIDNDSSLEALTKVAVSQAQSGADVVSPSAMMDGQVKTIRQGLDDAGFSGEYAMVKAAAMQGWIDEKEVTLEILTAIKRAGADMIVTYFSKSAAKILNEK